MPLATQSHSGKPTRGPTGHERDISSRDVERMSALTAYPELLSLLVAKSREVIGFFPAHNPRALEYPWILANVPADLRGLRMLDVGAGVNPLPFVLADRGAAVVTVIAVIVVAGSTVVDAANGRCTRCFS